MASSYRMMFMQSIINNRLDKLKRKSVKVFII